MKNMSVKKIVAMIVGAAAVLAVAAVAAVLALRVDSAEAQQIALDTVGGGRSSHRRSAVRAFGMSTATKSSTGTRGTTSKSAASAPSQSWRASAASIPGAEPTAALAPGGRLLYNGRVNCGPGAACTGGITL